MNKYLSETFKISSTSQTHPFNLKEIANESKQYLLLSI